MEFLASWAPCECDQQRAIEINFMWNAINARSISLDLPFCVDATDDVIAAAERVFFLFRSQQ